MVGGNSAAEKEAEEASAAYLRRSGSEQTRERAEQTTTRMGSWWRWAVGLREGIREAGIVRRKQRPHRRIDSTSAGGGSHGAAIFLFFGDGWIRWGRESRTGQMGWGRGGGGHRRQQPPRQMDSDAVGRWLHGAPFQMAG